MNLLITIISWFTGIIFLSLMFPVTFLIWLAALPFDRKSAVIHWLLVYQSVILSCIIPAWKIRITGREKIRKGTTYVIIANHQSTLDIILLNCIRMRYKWISKIETYRIPVIGWYLRMAKYITVDREDNESKEKMLQKCRECLKGGTSIMIFPEGTRSTDGQPGYFKRGAFQLAMETGVPILPVLITGTGEVLPKHGIMVKERREISINIFDPVYPESFGTSDPMELAAIFRTRMVKAKSGDFT